MQPIEFPNVNCDRALSVLTANTGLTGCQRHRSIKAAPYCTASWTRCVPVGMYSTHSCGIFSLLSPRVAPASSRTPDHSCRYNRRTRTQPQLVPYTIILLMCTCPWHSKLTRIMVWQGGSGRYKIPNLPASAAQGHSVARGTNPRTYDAVSAI
jgi:hypothetical protein